MRESCEARPRAARNFGHLYLWLPTNRCFVYAKRLLLGAWNFCWFLVLGTGRLVRAKRPLLETHRKAHATSLAPAPSEAGPGQIHFGNQKKYCATLRPNTIFSCDARPRTAAADYECSDKVHPFHKVSSRARETLTFEALQNSKRGKCRLGHTQHPLLSILELRI